MTSSNDTSDHVLLEDSPINQVPKSQVVWLSGIVISFHVVYFGMIVWDSGLRNYVSPEYQKYVEHSLSFLIIIFTALSVRELIPFFVLIIRDFYWHWSIYPRLQYEQFQKEQQLRHDRTIAKLFEEFKLKPIGEPVNLKEWVRNRRSIDGGYIYILKDVEISQTYKIGKTYKPYQRMKAFGVHLPFATELIHVIQCDNADRVERQLHNHFADKRRNGEWFALSEEDIRWLKLHHEINSPNGENHDRAD